MTHLLSVSSILKYGGYILLAILVLLFMVMIHELGHYIAGKILKFKINEFSVGFGPKIIQKTKKDGEKVSLRALPLGGYCAFEGEDEDGNESPEAFNNQKPWKRLIVLFSGAFFNFLSAIIFSFILLFANGYDLVQVNKVDTTSINYGHLYTQDVVIGVNGDNIDFVHDRSLNVLITRYVKEHYNSYQGSNLQEEYSYTLESGTYYLDTKDILYNIRRDGDDLSVGGKINVIYDSEGKCSGWTLCSTEDTSSKEFGLVTYRYSFGESLVQAVPFACKWAYKVLLIFGDLITGQLDLSAIGGPVTTINMIASNAQQSMNYLLILLPVIAVNLAVFNLLPIPALDGCQMIFVLIEWIRRKSINRKVVNMINNVGLILLLGFVVLVDILQFI